MGMQYTIEYALTLQDLQRQVNKWLQIGWRPAGGVATWTERDNRGFDLTYFGQALKTGGRAK